MHYESLCMKAVNQSIGEAKLYYLLTNLSFALLQWNTNKIHQESVRRIWECIFVQNLSLGRAIRHKRDYATILLLDQRYGSTRIQKSFPGWISNRLQHQPRFGSAFAAIRKVSYWSVGERWVLPVSNESSKLVQKIVRLPSRVNASFNLNCLIKSLFDSREPFFCSFHLLKQIVMCWGKKGKYFQNGGALSRIFITF